MTTCDFVSGLASGMANVVVGHPFDTVKVNEQILNSGTLKAIKSIYSLHGVRGYFRGIFFPLVTSGYQNAIFFSTYQMIMHRLNVDERRLKIRLSQDHSILGQTKQLEQVKSARHYRNCFLGGVCAGGVQSVFVGPVEMVKTNLQATKHSAEGKPQFTTTFSMIRYLYKANGLRTFYQGYSALVLRDVPSFGVYMSTYSMLKDLKIFSSRYSTGSTKFLDHFFSGGTAGTLAWWISIPPDVLKSKIETDDPRRRTWPDLSSCAKDIYRKNGLRGFFAGFWTISIRAFPVNGAVFMAYEFARKVCKNLDVDGAK